MKDKAVQKVLISPGYGAGWSTWNDVKLATDPQVIEAFERGVTEEEMSNLCVALGYEEPFMGGFTQLQIETVPVGEYFRVAEYDGSEYIEVFDKSEWILAHN